MIITSSSAISEDAIERAVELKIDRLDCSFTKGVLTQEQYELSMREINVWAEEMYRQIFKQSV